MRTITKDPNAVLDYGREWDDWLVPGDAVQSAAWTVTGPDSSLTLANDEINGTTCTVWCAGGTEGRAYVITCRVTTTAGRIDDRSTRIRIEQR